MDAAVWNIKADGVVRCGHKSPGPDTSAGEQRGGGDKAQHKLTELLVGSQPSMTLVNVLKLADVDIIKIMCQNSSEFCHCSVISSQCQTNSNR